MDKRLVEDDTTLQVLSSVPTLVHTFEKNRCSADKLCGCERDEVTVDEPQNRLTEIDVLPRAKAAHFVMKVAQTLQESLKEQAAGVQCQEASRADGYLNSCYCYSSNRILIRTLPNDSPFQNAVVVTFWVCALYLSPYLTEVGQDTERRTHDTKRRHLYRLYWANEEYTIVKQSR